MVAFPIVVSLARFLLLNLRRRIRHCEPTGRRKAPPDDRLREAINLPHETQDWIASSLRSSQ
jgi:hypothetical protein